MEKYLCKVDDPCLIMILHNFFISLKIELFMYQVPEARGVIFELSPHLLSYLMHVSREGILHKLA